MYITNQKAMSIGGYKKSPTAKSLADRKYRYTKANLNGVTVNIKDAIMGEGNKFNPGRYATSAFIHLDRDTGFSVDVDAEALSWERAGVRISLGKEHGTALSLSWENTDIFMNKAQAQALVNQLKEAGITAR